MHRRCLHASITLLSISVTLIALATAAHAEIPATWCDKLVTIGSDGDYLHRPDTPKGVTRWSTGVGNEWIVDCTEVDRRQRPRVLKFGLRSWKGDYLVVEGGEWKGDFHQDRNQRITSGPRAAASQWYAQAHAGKDGVYRLRSDSKKWFLDRGEGRDVVAGRQGHGWQITHRSSLPMGRVGYLRSSGSRLYLHARGGSSNGARGTLHPCPKSDDHANCQWQFEKSPTRPGAFYLKIKDTALYAHALGGAKSGANITLHPCPKSDDHANCQWFLEPSTTRAGSFYLRSAGSELALHASGGVTAGAQATLHRCPVDNDHANCQWSFE